MQNMKVWDKLKSEICCNKKNAWESVTESTLLYFAEFYWGGGKGYVIMTFSYLEILEDL